MSVCNFKPSKYLLGTQPGGGNNFIFANNFAYDNANKLIYVGVANPASGDITSIECTISIVNSRVKIEITKESSDRGTLYFFNFEIVGSYTSNLFLSMSDKGSPEFTIRNDSANQLSFIGTEDIRTGYVELPFPIENEDVLGGVFLKYDSTKKALFINVK